MNPSQYFEKISHMFNIFTDSLFHTPLTDEIKIQFLKEELTAGRYEIQSQSLATKLIEHIHPARKTELT